MDKIRIIRPKYIENIVIESNSLELIEHIKEFYGEYAVPAGDDSPSIIINEVEGKAEISYSNERVVCDDALLSLSEYLFDHTEIESDYFAMHAGAVEFGGKAYIFTAPTGTGKTTLTAYLLSKGFGYITDDCALIEKSTMNVFPYSKPLHLRDGGMLVLKDSRIELDTKQIVRRYVDRYVWTPQNTIECELPLAGIFFLNRQTGENSVKKLSQKEAIAELMISPITHFEIDMNYLAFLKKLADVGCERIVYDDMSFVEERIKHHGH